MPAYATLRTRLGAAKHHMDLALEAVPTVIQACPPDTAADQKATVMFQNRTLFTRLTTRLTARINKIETLDSQYREAIEDLPELESQYDSFSQSYMDLVETATTVIADLAGASAEIDYLLNHASPTTQQRNSAPTVHTTGALPKLPDLKLPRFDGNPVNWPAFAERFKLTVHESHLSDQHKMQYLLNFVSDEALSCLAGFNIAGKNYKDAFALLEAYFGDSRKVVNSLFRKLQAHPPVTPGPRLIPRLREYLYCIESTRLQLRSYGEDVDSAGNRNCVLPALMQKVPPDIMSKLQMLKTNFLLETKLTQMQLGKNSDAGTVSSTTSMADEPWTFDLFERVLKVVIDNLEEKQHHSQVTTNSTTTAGSATHRTHKASKQHPQHSTPPNLSNVFQVSNQVPHRRFESQGHSDRAPRSPFNFRAGGRMPKQKQKPLQKRECRFCGQNHFSSDCKLYATHDERTKACTNEMLCFRCLERHQGLERRQCPSASRPCLFCKGTNHHPAFCYQHLAEKKPKMAAMTLTATQPSPRYSDYDKNTMQQTVQTVTAQPVPPPESEMNTEAVVMSIKQPVQRASHLMTISVPIQYKGRDSTYCARALLDTGSSDSFITEELATKLNLPVHDVQNLELQAFSDKLVKHTAKKVAFTAYTKAATPVQFRAFTVPESFMAQEETPHFTAKDLQFLSNKRLTDLADNQLGEKKKIELLIGANYFFSIVKFEGVETLPSGLTLVPSLFGLIVCGSESQTSVNKSISQKVTVKTVTRTKIIEAETDENIVMINNNVKEEKGNNDIQRFWTTENLGLSEELSPTEEEQIATDHFESTVAIVDGRIRVGFPWYPEHPPLPSNFGLALSRLRSLFKQFERDKELKTQYQKIIMTQLEKGILEPVPQGKKGEREHFLAHFAVKAPSKSIRCVVDGSARERPDSHSLNDVMIKGKVVIPDIACLLIYFRTKVAVCVSDLQSAFLMLSLKPEDRASVKFLWVKDMDAPVTPDNLWHLQFARIPFGCLSSPAILSMSLRWALSNHPNPLAKTFIDRMYVDNLICGYDSNEAFDTFYEESKEIFDSWSMNLRQYACSDPEFMNRLPEADKIPDETIKVLGLIWNFKNDTLQYNISLPDLTAIPVTKRLIQSYVARIFDPLGLLVPLLLEAKCLIQSLHVGKFDWDDRLPLHLTTKWEDIKTELLKTVELKFPRCQKLLSTDDYEIHIFVDASEKAMACTAYLRRSHKGTVHTHLLMAKSTLSPTTPKLTIPRLELLAIVNGTKLLNHIRKNNCLEGNLTGCFIHSDSQISLSWTKSTKKLHRYVENRVRKIRECEATFRFINTEENPADLGTRGCPVTDLVNPAHIWWQGPKFLTQPHEQWPIHNLPDIDQTVLEEAAKTRATNASTELTPSKAVAVIHQIQAVGDPTVAPEIIDVQRYSNLNRLLNATTYVLRFISRVSSKRIARKQTESTWLASQLTDLEPKGAITEKERAIAMKLIIKLDQQKHYSDELRELSNDRIPNTIRGLNPQLDSVGTIRCHSRLGHANVNPAMLLHKDSQITKLLVTFVHRHLQHAGVPQVLNQLREQFWLPSGRSIIQAILRRCVQCRRNFGGAYIHPPMPHLPKGRVNDRGNRGCFIETGCDYFGPITTKEDDNKCHSRMVLLFVCMQTRAVHLEPCRSNSSKDLCDSFRLFLARRGAVSVMRSDNQQSYKEFSRLLQTKIDALGDDTLLSYAARKGIKWQFTCPAASMSAGNWERLVGVVKRAIKGAIGHKYITYDTLRVMLAETEAIVNARPLTWTFSTSFADAAFKPLRPCDFLTPGKHSAIAHLPNLNPDEDDDDYEPVTKSALVKRYLELDVLLEKFWRRWEKEYLQSLRERTQVDHKQGRVTAHFTPKVGHLVLIHQEVSPRGAFKLGKIIQLSGFDDQNPKSAELLLGNRMSIRRPITKLYPIEVSEEEDQQNERSRHKQVRPAINMTTADWLNKELSALHEAKRRMNLIMMALENADLAGALTHVARTIEDRLSQSQMAIASQPPDPTPPSLNVTNEPLVSDSQSDSEIADTQANQGEPAPAAMPPQNIDTRQSRRLLGLPPTTTVTVLCISLFIMTTGVHQVQAEPSIKHEVTTHSETVIWALITIGVMQALLIATCCVYNKIPTRSRKRRTYRRVTHELPPGDAHTQSHLMSTTTDEITDEEIQTNRQDTNSLRSSLLTGSYAQATTLTWCLYLALALAVGATETQHPWITLPISKSANQVIMPLGCTFPYEVNQHQPDLINFTTYHGVKPVSRPYVCITSGNMTLAIEIVNTITTCYKYHVTYTRAHEVKVWTDSACLQKDHCTWAEACLYHTSRQPISILQRANATKYNQTRSGNSHCFLAIPENDNSCSIGGVTLPSCVYYRLFAMPTNNKLYEVFTCDSWETRARVRIHELDWNTDRYSTVEIRATNQQKFVWNRVALTLNLSFPEQVNKARQLNQMFLTDQETIVELSSTTVPKTSLSSTSMALQVQCGSKNLAQTMNCEFYGSRCNHSHTQNQPECELSDVTLETMMSQPLGTLRFPKGRNKQNDQVFVGFIDNSGGTIAIDAQNSLQATPNIRFINLRVDVHPTSEPLTQQDSLTKERILLYLGALLLVQALILGYQTFHTCCRRRHLNVIFDEAHLTPSADNSSDDTESVLPLETSNPGRQPTIARYRLPDSSIMLSILLLSMIQQGQTTPVRVDGSHEILKHNLPLTHYSSTTHNKEDYPLSDLQLPTTTVKGTPYREPPSTLQILSVVAFVIFLIELFYLIHMSSITHRQPRYIPRRMTFRSLETRTQNNDVTPCRPLDIMPENSDRSIESPPSSGCSSPHAQSSTCISVSIPSSFWGEEEQTESTSSFEKLKFPLAPTPNSEESSDDESQTSVQSTGKSALTTQSLTGSIRAVSFAISFLALLNTTNADTSEKCAIHLHDHFLNETQTITLPLSNHPCIHIQTESEGWPNIVSMQLLAVHISAKQQLRYYTRSYNANREKISTCLGNKDCPDQQTCSVHPKSLQGALVLQKSLICTMLPNKDCQSGHKCDIERTQVQADTPDVYSIVACNEPVITTSVILEAEYRNYTIVERVQFNLSQPITWKNLNLTIHAQEALKKWSDFSLLFKEGSGKRFLVHQHGRPEPWNLEAVGDLQFPTIRHAINMTGFVLPDVCKCSKNLRCICKMVDLVRQWEHKDSPIFTQIGERVYSTLPPKNLGIKLSLSPIHPNPSLPNAKGNRWIIAIGAIGTLAFLLTGSTLGYVKSRQRNSSGTYVELALLLLTITTEIHGETDNLELGECELPTQNLTFLQSERCVKVGYTFHERADRTLCWKLVTCGRSQHLNNKGNCVYRCPCPEPGVSCTHSTFVPRDMPAVTKISDILEQEKPDVCSYQANSECNPTPMYISLPFVTLYNDSRKHYIRDLNVKIELKMQPENFFCLGESDGLRTGTKEYCKLQACVPKALSLCWYTHEEIAYLNSQFGQIPIKSWGFATGIQIYGPPNSDEHLPSICPDCSAKCQEKGVKLELTDTIGSVSLSTPPFSYVISFPQKTVQFNLPDEVLLEKHEVEIIAWSKGTVVYRANLTCDAQDYCASLHCTACADYLLSPACSPQGTILVVALISYLVTLSLYFMTKMFKHIYVTCHNVCTCMMACQKCCRKLGRKLSRKTARSISKRAEPIYQMLQQEGSDEDQSIFDQTEDSHTLDWDMNFTDRAKLSQSTPHIPQPPPRRSHQFASVTTLKLIWALTYILTCVKPAIGCAENIVATASERTCIQTNGKNDSCYVSVVARIPSAPTSQLSCLTVTTDDGTEVASITIEVKQIQLICHKRELFYTRNIIYKVTSLHQCYFVNDCDASYCSDVKTDTKVAALPISESGNTFMNCESVHSGFSAGCFATRSCLFSAIWPDTRSPTVYSVFDCPEFEYKTSVTLTITADGQEHRVNTYLMPGVPARFRDIRFALDTISAPPAPLLNTQFMSDGKRTSMVFAPMQGTGMSNTIGALQCDTYRQAELLQGCVQAPPNCDCTVRFFKKVCNCYNQDLDEIMQDENRLLPKETANMVLLPHDKAGVHGLMKNNFAFSLVVSMKGVKFSTKVNINRCRLSTTSVAGCYNCVTGAVVRYACESTQSPTTAIVNCTSTGQQMQWLAKCSPTATEQHIVLHSTKPILDESCTIRCNGGGHDFTLKGTLMYVTNKHSGQVVNKYNVLNPPSTWGLDISSLAKLFPTSWITYIYTIIGVLIAAAATILLSPIVFSAFTTLCRMAWTKNKSA